MLAIKSGAAIRGISPEITIGLIIVGGVLLKHGISMTVLTEGTGGKHGNGSLHFVGYAADIRSSSVPHDLLDTVVEEVREALGGAKSEFDFVVETDHFHLEFQPKTPING